MEGRYVVLRKCITGETYICLKNGKYQPHIGKDIPNSLCFEGKKQANDYLIHFKSMFPFDTYTLGCV